MAHLFAVSISKKAVLKYNFAANLPAFDGDATQIRQIIMNLITNASEAIGDKSGVIALSTGAMDCDRAYLDEVDEVLRAGLDEPLPEGTYTFFEVADTGCGKGLAAFLQKPYRMAALREKLREILGDQPSQGDAPGAAEILTGVR